MLIAVASCIWFCYGIFNSIRYSFPGAEIYPHRALVVWTMEFDRSPHAEGEYGCGHFNAGFSSWLAGGGIKGGIVYGKSDEYGHKVAENEVHVHDFHATILHCLGFDHTRLTFWHGGRDYRLTDVPGHVVKAILA